MSFMKTLSKFMAIDTEEETENKGFREGADDGVPVFSTPKKKTFVSEKANPVVEINTTAKLEVVVMTPVVFEDAKDIADYLKTKNPVVINLESVERDVTRRIVDFLSGAVYAVEGNIQKISNDIFLVTPYNVSVLGNFKDDLKKGVLPWETPDYN